MHRKDLEGSEWRGCQPILWPANLPETLVLESILATRHTCTAGKALIKIKYGHEPDNWSEIIWKTVPLITDFNYPIDCSLLGSAVHAISQARTLEWVAVSSSRDSSQHRDWTQVSCISCIAGGFFTTEPSRKPLCWILSQGRQEQRFCFNLLTLVVRWIGFNAFTIPTRIWLPVGEQISASRCCAFRHSQINFSY